MYPCPHCGQLHTIKHEGYVVQREERPGGTWLTMTRPAKKKSEALAVAAMMDGRTRIWNVYTRKESFA